MFGSGNASVDPRFGDNDFQPRESNQDMLQNPPMVPNFRMIPSAPFRTNQGYGKNETQTLDFVQTMAPIKWQTQATTTETYNAPNLNPRTFQGGNVAGMIPYGQARGQLSLLTNLDLNKPSKMLIMNNKSVFKQVASEKKMVHIPPSRI